MRLRNMSRVSVAGVDCGLDGAVALVSDSGLVSVELVPTIKVGKGNKRDYDVSGMTRILEEMRNNEQAYGSTLWVYIEKQQAMPGYGPICPKCKRRKSQGVASTMKIGRGMGLWEGIVDALKINSVPPVHPRTWQAKICRDVIGDDTKARSILAAQKLYPGTDFRKSNHPNCRVPHHGKTDAACIARYGWLHEKGLI